MTEKLQLRDAVYRLEDTIREIRNRFADDQGRVDEIAFEEGKADPLLALAVPLVLPRRRGQRLGRCSRLRSPTIGMIGRCAWAPSGHAAAPPNSVMLSAE